jgi:hypothetical protein
MFARLKRTVAVLAATMCAFLAYHVAAVPFIEPTFEVRSSHESGPIASESRRDRTNVLRPYFPPGSRILDDPIMLESDQSKLLFNTYEVDKRDNRKVMLKPCAVVFFPSGDLTRDAPQRVFVLEAPQGALLQFDSPVDLQGMKLGQLQGGDMKGPVTIHGTPSRAGANDEIVFETRDVVMSPETISTDAPVDFRCGPSTGHGRQMVLHLRRSAPTAGQRGPNIGGVDSLELLHDVQMRLISTAGGIMPLDGQRGVTSASTNPTATPRPVSDVAPTAMPSPPVDVRCEGPFKFDLAQYIATFQDRVTVNRQFDNGLRDWLNCERLSIFFTPRPDAAATSASSKAIAANESPPKSTQRSQNLEPRRIEARGKPVTVHAESNGVFAQVEHLAYDIEPGQLGQFDSEGQGWLRATPRQTAARPATTALSGARPAARLGMTQLGLPVAPSHSPARPQVFEAHWSEFLRMRPYEDEHVVSLKGSARAAMAGQGELWGDEIYVWIKDRPPATAVKAESGPNRAPGPSETGATPSTADTSSSHWQIIADRMLAQGHVQINSPQLSGATSLLRAWFTQAAPEVRQSVAGAAVSAQAPGTFATGGFGPSPNGQLQQGSPGVPPRHYHVEGERIDLQLLTGTRGTEVEGVTIDGQASFGESQSPQPGEPPLLVAGQKIDVLRANAPDTAVTVSGKPAEVGARGMVLRGDVVRLDKQRNLLWIDGPGQMTVPMNQSMAANLWPGAGEAHTTAAQTMALPSAARPPSVTDLLYVNWKDRMSFDGSVAHFEHSIVGRSTTRDFTTDTLDVSLRRRIDFSQPRMEERAEIDGIIMRSGVWLENRGFDTRDPKKLLSIDRMRALSLAIYESSGKILGEGPGELTSVRVAAPDSTGPQTTTRVAAKPAAATGPADARTGSRQPGFGGLMGGRNGHPNERSPFNYLNVRFAGPISGDLNRHEVTLHERVRSIYGPVAAWEARLNPDELGPDDVLMNCDLLTVRQMNPNPAAADPQHHPIELEAEGNTEIEGDVFTARAHRMTYTEAKDVLMLEGDGRNMAELYRQVLPGAESGRTQAHQILYFPSTDQFSINGGGASDFNLGPAPPKTKKQPKTTGAPTAAGGAK